MNSNNLVSIFRKIRIDLLIIVGCIALFIPLAIFSRPTRVGDGSEYYALSLAWSSTHKPFMTDESWLRYDHLFNSGEINSLVDSITLQKWFPGLILGSTEDLAHFWFYSFCAAVISEFGDIVGIRIPIHVTFLMLHCLLLASMFVIARRTYGWKGLVAAFILTFLSPIIWYFDKVHTELF